MSEHEDRALVEKALRIWNEADLHLVDEVYAEDFSLRTAGPMGSGRDAIKDEVRVFSAGFTGQHFELVSMMRDGGRIMFRYVGEAKHTGSYQGIQATGRQVCLGGMSELRLRDGKVVEAWEYVDRYGLMEQLGAGPSQRGAMAGEAQSEGSVAGQEGRTREAA